MYGYDILRCELSEPGGRVIKISQMWSCKTVYISLHGVPKVNNVFFCTTIHGKGHHANL